MTAAAYEVYALDLGNEPVSAYFGARRFASQFEQWGRTHVLALQSNY